MSERVIGAARAARSRAALALAHTGLVLDSLPRAVVVLDLEGVILAWNRVAETVYGWPADEVVGRPVNGVLLTATEHERAHRIVAQVAAGEVWSGDLTVARGEGGVVRTFTFVGPLRDAEGEIVGVLATSDDVTERRLLEQQAADLTDRLVLALAAGGLGTWQWDLATGVTTWDVTLEALFGLEPGSFDGTFDAWVARLHPDDAPAALAEVKDAVAGKRSYELEHRVMWPDGSVHWLHSRGMVTLDAEGNVTGSIGSSADITARKIDELDAERRARQARVLTERERLQSERLQFLAALNEAALAATDHRQLMRATAAAAVPRLGDWCAVHFLPEPGAALEVEVVHHDPAKVEWATDLLARYPYDPDAGTGVAAVMRTGQVEFLPDLDEAFVAGAVEASATAVPPEELRAILDTLALTSAITVPLRTKRGVVGALQVVSVESKRRLDEDDVALAEAAAGRIAEALDNVWLAEQHRTIATTLQAALLPPLLPRIEGIDVAVRYWAAGTVTEAGGDFYDVFRVDDTRWAVVIGDVCGTGPHAAAVTAIARHTIRAAATHGATHTEVLDWLNDALHAGNRGLFCTAIYATLEPADPRHPGTWRYTMVAGGHPLPYVVRADGSTATVGVPGTLLGVLPAVTSTVVTLDLAVGDTLILYTDGVTDVAPPYGLDPDALTALIAQAATADSVDAVASSLGDAVQAILPIPERNDDVALIVARITEASAPPM